VHLAIGAFLLAAGVDAKKTEFAQSEP
jgi:hypothetical protein